VNRAQGLRGRRPRSERVENGRCEVAYERATEIRNQEGLHFRPIMRLIDALTPLTAKVTLHTDDRAADARSPMEMLMLVATQGTRIRVVGEGPDEQAAVDALVSLIECGFQES